MEKYQSFHFSPLNNRSMLMPRIPKGTEYHVDSSRLVNPFEPIPEEVLKGRAPYSLLNSGFFKKEIELEGAKRPYGLYAPQNLWSKGACAVIFAESGVTAEEFIKTGNWKQLADKYLVSLLILESPKWEKEQIEREFDYAWTTVYHEFSKRPTVDICESFFYPIGLGDAAGIAAAFALTYSATFPAFAVCGDCSVDPELLNVLRKLPSDGIDTWKKTEIAMPGFLIDKKGNAEAVFEYIKEINRVKEENLINQYGSVYLEQPRRGAYYVNEQPISQVWLADENSTKKFDQNEINEAMLRFVLRFSLWGGSGNNHLRPKRSWEEIGVIRVEKEIAGLPRYWDIYVPSCYRPDDQKEYPLVVAIHGFSCSPEYFEQTSDWHRLAEERGFFVVYAAAYPRNVGRSRFPLPGWCVWPIDQEGVNESEYFKVMLDDMEEKYPIDNKRIYAVGHSNGGRMTQRLSRTMPERFAAFGPTGALGGKSADAIEPIDDHMKCPIAFMMGEYDMVSPSVEEGSIARETLKAYCRANHMTPQFENWYDNGIYHTLVMYDKDHVPMIRYTIMKGCPHTYTGEMAQLTWDTFLCHFTREADGSIQYHG